MNDELDPALQIAFANAERELVDEDFIDQVMADVTKRRRQPAYVWIAASVAGIATMWFLAAPLQNLALFILQGLNAPLAPQYDGMAMQLFAPLNSVAGVLALLLLAGQMLWRRIRG